MIDEFGPTPNLCVTSLYFYSCVTLSLSNCTIMHRLLRESYFVILDINPIIDNNTLNIFDEVWEQQTSYLRTTSSNRTTF